MYFSTPFIVLVATATGTHAVKISLFGRILGVQCTGTSTLVYTDIAAGDCCTMAPQLIYSALFSGLPLPVAQGIAYKTGPGCSNTATSCGTGSGTALCLSCGATPITGAEWLNPMSKREEEDRSCNTPDRAQIDGHWFIIFHNDQSSAFEQLVNLALAGNTTHESIPSSLRPLKISNTNGWNSFYLQYFIADVTVGARLGHS